MSKQLEVSNPEPTMPLNTRANSALQGIYEISKALARPARLEITLAGVINLLASFLDMKNGLIALLDEEDRTATVVGSGWSEETPREHFERLPEQAVGQIIVSGGLTDAVLSGMPFGGHWDGELETTGSEARGKTEEICGR